MRNPSFQNAWNALALVTNLATSASATYTTTTDSKCGCYLTNTTAQNFFSRHKFFDFRNKWQYVNVAPPLEDAAANTQAGVTSSYFTSPEWKDAWEIQNWNKSASLNSTSEGDATLLMINTANNVYFERSNDTKASANTYLTLRTVRHENFQSAAEFDSVSGDYHYLSMRMLARTRGAGGAITAMFTYRGGDAASSVQEADLEVRTSDPKNVIQYTNQPSNHNVTGSTQNVTLPARLAWSDWQYHRVDWAPGASSWFVNGQLVSRITSQAPRDPSRILFNAWSDGGSWSGNMPIGSEAFLQIQWIDMVYNNTDSSIGLNPNVHNGRCSSVCSIDQTRTIGTPVLVSGDGGGGQSCTAAKYGQCAGQGWNGCGACAQGSNCKFQNNYYSQCL